MDTTSQPQSLPSSGTIGRMSRSYDLLGLHVGMLTVIERTRLGLGVGWVCRCACGETRTVSTSDLRRTDGRAPISCGCHKRGPRIDLTGQKFGRLTAVENTRLNDLVAWICECECGQTKIVPTATLRNGGTRSCGCLDADNRRLKPFRLVHGDTRGRRRTREHVTWSSMLARCYNPKNPEYQSYGGRGIKVCDRWRGKDGYANFLADMGRRPPGTSIDRYPNNDGDYEPTNCRWATRQEQARNTSATLMVDFRGRRVSLQEVAEITGVRFHTLYDRIYRYGVSLDQAVRTDDRRAVYVTYKGERMMLKDVAATCGMQLSTLLYRLKHGWSLDEATTDPVRRSAQ